MKHFFAAFALCALFAAAFYAEPLLPLPDARASALEGFSFDTQSKGKVVLVNDSYDEDIDFQLFCLNKDGSAWQLLGKASLDDTGDTDSLSLKKAKGIPRVISCLAVLPLGSRTYSFSTEMRKNDLYIHVLQVLPPPPESNACVIDVGKLKGDFEDDIRLISRIYDEDVLFALYYWDHKEAVWKSFGKAELEDFKDTDRVDTPLDEEDIESIRIVAVAAQNGKSYSFRAEIDDDDLYIYVMPPK